MRRLIAASCLFAALMTVTTRSARAERVTLEVVRAHTGVRLADLANAHTPGTITRCDSKSGGYTREFGLACINTADLLKPVSAEAVPDFLFSYDVHVVLPDSARVLLHCSSILDAHCEGLPAYSEPTSITCSDFVTGGTRYKDCTASPEANDHIGTYQAAIYNDHITIYGADWQRDYITYGTWKPEDVPPQEAAPTQNPPAAPPASAPPAAPAGTATPVENAVIIDPQVIADAHSGNPVAQYKLGYDYYLGHGVAQNYTQAAAWWRQAAEQGYADAQNNLGVLYNSGKGVPQSYAEAYFWQNLAAARSNGSLQAQFAKNRDESASRLSFFERLRVQKRASRWFNEHPAGAKAVAPPAAPAPSKTPEAKPAEAAQPTPQQPEQAKPETKPDAKPETPHRG